MVKCTNCNGTGDITPLKEIKSVFCDEPYPLYESVEIEKYPSDSLLIKLGKHTSYGGGESGDLIVKSNIESLIKLGYEIKGIGRNYIYIGPISS